MIQVDWNNIDLLKIPNSYSKYEGIKYTAYCGECGNSGGLYQHKDTLKITCWGCILYGHPSFALLSLETEEEILAGGIYSSD